MKLFVANCTQQVQDFQYRLQENPKVIKIEIQIGRQVQLPHDLTKPEVDYITNQHRPYGMVAVDEVDRSQNFNGLCYSIDKPIDVDRLRNAVHHNHEVLVERGKQLRLEAAVAVNDTLSDDRSLQAVELSVEELASKSSPKDLEVNETVRVDRSAPEGSIRKGRR